MLNKVTLRTCPSRVPRLASCHLLIIVRPWAPCLPVCVFVCVFLTAPFFSATSMPDSPCWHGRGAAGSLHSNLPSFVITCPRDTHAPTHMHTHICRDWRPYDCHFGLSYTPLRYWVPRVVEIVWLKTFLMSLQWQLLLQTVQLSLRFHIVHRY